MGGRTLRERSRCVGGQGPPRQTKRIQVQPCRREFQHLAIYGVVVTSKLQSMLEKLPKATRTAHMSYNRMQPNRAPVGERPDVLRRFYLLTVFLQLQSNATFITIEPCTKLPCTKFRDSRPCETSLPSGGRPPREGRAEAALVR